jgi:D-glycero-D-manno-heptose 1,7-bisphosphate phosphatase
MSGGPSADARAVFLDRDGVINELVLDERSGAYESPYRAADVALMPGVPDALRALRDHGFRLVVVSNQPAAAKGTATLEGLEAVHKRVEALLAEHAVRLDASYYCFHHPDGTDPELKGPCHCRKPAPGLILDAAAELGLALGASWVVGDANRDVVAGRLAGCRTILVENSRSRQRRGGTVEVDAVAQDLPEAASFVIDNSGR